MKNYICFGILIKLLQKGRLTVKTLACEFEVCEKTIRRYITLMDCSGIPLISFPGKNGGIEISSSFSLKDSYFSKDEIARILCTLNSIPINFGKQIDNVLKDKLTLLVNPAEEAKLKLNQLMFVDSNPWCSELKENKLSDIINKCIINETKLVVLYKNSKDEVENRVIHPYTLVLKEGSMYVYAFCEKRNDFRVFKLSRIITTFGYSENFKRRTVNGTAPWDTSFKNQAPKVNLKISAPKTLLNELKEWLEINTAKQLNDNEIELSATTHFTKSTILKLLSYGNKIKILSPFSAKEQVINFCKEIETLYKTS